MFGVVVGIGVAICLLVRVFKFRRYRTGHRLLHQGVPFLVSVICLLIHFSTSPSGFTYFLSIVGFVVTPITFIVAIIYPIIDIAYNMFFNREEYLRKKEEAADFGRRLQQYESDRFANRMNENLPGAKEYNRKKGW